VSKPTLPRLLSAFRRNARLSDGSRGSTNDPPPSRLSQAERPGRPGEASFFSACYRSVTRAASLPDAIPKMANAPVLTLKVSDGTLPDENGGL
jgi:hypothetical protein